VLFRFRPRRLAVPARAAVRQTHRSRFLPTPGPSLSLPPWSQIHIPGAPRLSREKNTQAAVRRPFPLLSLRMSSRPNGRHLRSLPLPRCPALLAYSTLRPFRLFPFLRRRGQSFQVPFQVPFRPQACQKSPQSPRATRWLRIRLRRRSISVHLDFPALRQTHRTLAFPQRAIF